jgi:hypothetical protein
MQAGCDRAVTDISSNLVKVQQVINNKGVKVKKVQSIQSEKSQARHHRHERIGIMMM